MLSFEFLLQGNVKRQSVRKDYEVTGWGIKYEYY